MIRFFFLKGSMFSMVVLLFTACEYDTIVPAEVILPDSVSFSNDIIPIFETNCNSAGCHNTGGIAPDLTSEQAYSDIVLYNYIDTTIVPEETSFMKKLDGSMKKYILPAEYELILLWIEQNAPDN